MVISSSGEFGTSRDKHDEIKRTFMRSRDSRWNIIVCREGDTKQQTNIVVAIHCGSLLLHTLLVMAHHGVHAALYLSLQPPPQSKLGRAGWILEVHMAIFRLREQ